MRPTKANLKKLEAFYKDIGYRVRYGKGYFQAGYCLNASQKHIIVNKMYTDVAKFNLLKELVADVEVNTEDMPEEMYKLYHKLLPKKVKKEQEAVAEEKEVVTEDKENE